MSSQPTSWKEQATDYFVKMGRVNLLNGVSAAENIRETTEASQRIQRAEESAVAKSMGWNDPHAEGDDVGDRVTVLGDYNAPPKEPASPVKRLEGLAKTAIALGLLGMGGGAGVAAAYLVPKLLDKPGVVSPVIPGESKVTIGLRRLADLVNETKTD